MLEEKVLAIIRLKSLTAEEEEDKNLLAESGYPGLEFEIPKVNIISKVSKDGAAFVKRPLLLNYGFVRIPISYARKFTYLKEISEISQIILGFFFRKKKDVELELKVIEETEGFKPYPIWVETIKEEELVFLNREARRIEDKRDYSSIDVGAYIILKNYPFEGLGAKVLKVKNNGRVQVEILSSQLRIWLDRDSLIYSDMSIYLQDGV